MILPLSQCSSNLFGGHTDVQIQVLVPVLVTAWLRLNTVTRHGKPQLKAMVAQTCQCYWQTSPSPVVGQKQARHPAAQSQKLCKTFTTLSCFEATENQAVHTHTMLSRHEWLKITQTSGDCMFS